MEKLALFEQITDAFHIPGYLLGLARRAWEPAAAEPADHETELPPDGDNLAAMDAFRSADLLAKSPPFTLSGNRVGAAPLTWPPPSGRARQSLGRSPITQASSHMPNSCWLNTSSELARAFGTLPGRPAAGSEVK